PVGEDRGRRVRSPVAVPDEVDMGGAEHYRAAMVGDAVAGHGRAREPDRRRVHPVDAAALAVRNPGAAAGTVAAWSRRRPPAPQGGVAGGGGSGGNGWRGGGEGGSGGGGGTDGAGHRRRGRQPRRAGRGRRTGWT